ncbi:MAG: sigma-70 family RNA polymerase sigma factor [Chloroflexi bacterium]|nr:MAG: sigma-70 family RNA polymerase sigma factor [Chloroflexota bacterium]
MSVRTASVSAARSEGELWSRARRGDGDSFAVATGRYRRELEVHAYRMLGSAEDAEDIVQETFLRAWRKRETFRGQATLRAWLYGIATNASLDLLERRSRRLLPHLVSAPIDPETLPEPSRDISWVRGEMTWLEPYPDRLLDEVVSGEDPPDEAIVARETVELAFLVAIQQLPPRQRAVLILRDVIGWSARETAAMLEMSVVASNSALQRAREMLRDYPPERRDEWHREHRPDPREQEVLMRYMDAWKRTDLNALAALLKEDAQLTMPPTPGWFFGRDAILRFYARYPFRVGASEHLHTPTRANRQPAHAVWRRVQPDAPPEPFGIEVLRIEDGLIAEIHYFLQPELIGRFAIAPPA